MTSQQEYRQRHAAMKDRLESIAAEKLNGGVLIGCKVIGENIGVAPQTVYNYISGRIKDGYLADAIYKELKKYKPKKD